MRIIEETGDRSRVRDLLTNANANLPFKAKVSFFSNHDENFLRKSAISIPTLSARLSGTGSIFSLAISSTAGRVIVVADFYNNLRYTSLYAATSIRNFATLFAKSLDPRIHIIYDSKKTFSVLPPR